MNDKIAFLSSGDDATGAFGTALAQAGLLPPGTVVALSGDLGAGKTVFSRGVARGLGITDHIPSPTFTIAQEYRLEDGHVLYHLDMYRIPDEESAIAFGIDEYLFNPNAISLIEWSERIPRLFDPQKTRWLNIVHQDETTRRLEFTNWPDMKAISLPDGIIPC